MSWKWEQFKQERDMILGWCDAQAGRPFNPNETEFWIAGFQTWPEPLRKPPTLSQEMSQISRSANGATSSSPQTKS